ncbi:DUF5946 family protein [Kibdelosporangium philippinense]|uniref:DUF5946 family protein n=1 Tax=Kibdelosporangium philippinense TaxID=211113 RepID=A0ABS8ZVR9_9PSEU|nr:DUF5946 family protein [Kibdelosporangium philippinense]MCE7010676.1 DUF5946 family protein [Kibdelosporangium philippinense]
MTTSACPGCGLVLPDTGRTPPAERGASAACFERYGELLARSYGIAAYRPVHQIVVDACIAQHPGGTSRRETQAIALCLMTLGLFVEDGADPRDGAELHKKMVANRPEFHPLAPPPLTGLMTVEDVLTASDAAEHAKLVWAWGTETWQAWAPHHATIRAWNKQALFDQELSGFRPHPPVHRPNGPPNQSD